MGTRTWNNSSGGNFNTATDWTPNFVPGVGDSALITASGSYTVSSTQNNTIGSLTTSAGATLAIANNTQFNVTSSISNAGTISLNSVGNATYLLAGGPSLSLSGGGHVTLSDNSQNYIYGASASTVLTNVDNTISGSGQLGNGQLTLVNQASGVINATGGSNQLVINTSGKTVTNTGLIEDTGSAGLRLVGTTFNNAGGTIEASGAGSHVDLQSATIQGGTLQTLGGGIFQTVDTGSVIDGSKSAVTDTANINVNNNTFLTLRGAIVNSGTIALNSVGNATELRVDGINTTLSGGGAITMTDNSQNYILGNAATYTLTNVNNTISGAGYIGDGQMTLVNQAGGVINGSGVNNALIVDPSANMINQGLMKGTAAGGLEIYSTGVKNSGTIQALGGRLYISSATVNNSGGGAISAQGANAHIDLQSGIIIGGTLTTDANSVINTLDTGSAIDNVAVTNAGTVNLLNNTFLTLGSTVTNSGTINLNSVGNATELRIDANNATLKGGGHVTLSDNGQNYIFGNAVGDTLTNVDNTISGAGQLGNGTLTFVNQAAGIVDGTGGNALIVNMGGNRLTNAGLMEGTSAGGLAISNTGATNSGTMEATSGGRLLIQSSTVKGTGTVEALGSGSHVDLQSALLNGGKLITDVNGTINTLDTGSVVDNVAVTNAGTINLLNNTFLTLGSTVTNSGTINLNSAGNATELRIDANNATLQGGGHVTLSDNGQNGVFGNAAGDTLTNVDNTISGAGQFGDGTLTFVNQAAGIVDGTGSNALIVNMGGNRLTNAGLMEGTSAGGLVIYNTGATNSGTMEAASGGRLLIQSSTIKGTGTVEALGAGSHVDLESALLNGGKLVTDVNGTINTLDTASVVDNVAVTNAGTINLLNNTFLTLGSTVTNTGTINLNSAGNATELRIDANNATLQGGGHVIMGDNAQNYIVGVTAGDTLTNVDNTISGAGQLGDGQLTLINGALGTINATGTHQLILNTGSNILQNSGKIEASSAAGLLIYGTTINQSKLGVVEAATLGSTVSLQSAQILGGIVTTVKGAVIQTLDTSSLIAGATMSNGGTILINNNTWLTIRGTLKNSGTITLNSTGNATELRIDAAGANLSGGKVTLTDSSQNYIQGNSTTATLTNSSNISGGGQIGNGQMVLVNQSKGILNGSGTNNALVVNVGASASANQGLMEGTGAAGLAIVNSSNLNNSGTIKAITGGGVLIQNSTVRGVAATTALIEALGTGSHVDLKSADLIGGKLTTDVNGTINALDTGSVLDNVAVTNAGTINLANNSFLYLGSTVTNSGAIKLNSVGNGTELRIDFNNATLQGGGHVTLSDNTQNYILGNEANDTLTNVDNTISGAGQLGNTQLTFVNQAAGIVDGTGANALTLNTSGSAVTNAGLMEGTSAGGLVISSTQVNNSGTVKAASGGRLLINSSTIESAIGGPGSVQALGAGSHVDLQSAILQGGSLTTDVNGAINTEDTGSAVDNVAVTNAGTINLLNSTFLYLGSTVINSGTINLNSGPNATELRIDFNNATLQGGGHVTLTDSTQNYILGNEANDTLINVDNTISGAGQLGNAQLTFINQAAGIVDGTGGNALTLNTSGSAMTNAGLMEGTSAGGLAIVSTQVNNSGTIKAASGGRLLVNSSTIESAIGGPGSVQALGAGSHVDLQSGVLLGGALTTDVNGTINTLDTGSVVDNVAVTNAGTINLENNTFLTLGSTVTNSGTINLSSSGNATELRIDSNNATLQGGGHVTLTDNSQNYIMGNAGIDTLTNVDNTISGAGQLGGGQMTLVNGGTINGNGTNALVINTGVNAITNSGTIQSSGSGGVSVSSTVNNSGKLWANGGNLAITGAVTGSGTGEITGAATLELGSGSTSSAAVTFDAGSTGTLRLDSSQSFAGTIAGLSLSGTNQLDLSDISFISGTTQANFVENGGGTSGILTVTDGTHTASLTLLGNYSSSTFTVATDGHSGTLVHDPVGTNPSVALITPANSQTVTSSLFAHG